MNEISLKTHYSVAELLKLKLSLLPQAHKNVLDKAKREHWESRKRAGRGGGVEYAMKSMPEEIQAEIVVKLGKSAVKNLPVLAQPQAPMDAQLLWEKYEQSTTKAQNVAKLKLGTMFDVAELVNAGVKLLDAFDLVCGKHNRECAAKGEKPLSIGSLKRWWYGIKDADRSLWLPLLIGESGHNGKNREAAFSDEAWAFFKADYFRNERPQFGNCYERLKRAAKANGWDIPSSSSIKRKIEREIPKTHQVYLREGEYAMSRYFPSLVRTVAEVDAMEWVNGDGYKHNVWVEWHTAWVTSGRRGEGAFVNQYGVTAPYYVDAGNTNGGSAYLPYLKGKVMNGDGWGTVFSFGYETPGERNRFGVGRIHLIEDNGHQKIWSFNHNGDFGSAGDVKTSSGKSLNTAVQFSDYRSQWQSNGWARLPNGLIIQWGKTPVVQDEKTADIVFPIAFPNKVLSVQLTENQMRTYHASAYTFSCT